MLTIPNVFIESEYGVATLDLLSRLTESNIILLVNPIDDDTAAIIITQLLHLATKLEGTDTPIHMYIMSPGGSVSAGFAIIDVMNKISTDIVTIGMGTVASMASLILMSGTPGYRMALPNTEILIHQPMGAVQGQATDIQIHAEHMLKTKQKIIKYMHLRTGQPVDYIEESIERDNILSVEEAISYGIIDKKLDSNNIKKQKIFEAYEKLKKQHSKKK